MKKHPSPFDIAEMKAKGFEPQTIEAAEEQCINWHAAERVREIISNAFKDVKLGNGVGLKQANGLDDYADDIKLATLRTLDEKENWQHISIDDLNQFQWGLSYFDPEGMRFHLPAFMIVDLNGDFMFDLIPKLTDPSEYSISQFSLFSEQQRDAVREFLNYAIEDEDSQYYLTDIIKALLEGYWQE